MRELILDGNDFTYTRFIEKDRGEGQSGPLLLGENDGMKLLVKHTYAADAANEFVACYIAAQMDLYNPTAHLLTHTPSFKSEYAVGIEFMDLKPIDVHNLTQEQQKELIQQAALNCLILQEDMIQMEMWNGHVVSYDFSVSFCQEGNFSRFLDRSLQRFGRMPHFYPNVALKMLELPDEMLPEIEEIYYESLRPLLNMDPWPLILALQSYFPDRIANYYEECIYKLQELVEEKLEEYEARLDEYYAQFGDSDEQFEDEIDRA